MCGPTSGGSRSGWQRGWLPVGATVIGGNLLALALAGGGFAAAAPVGARASARTVALDRPALVDIALPRPWAVLVSARTPLVVRLSPSATAATLRVTVNRRDVTRLLRRRGRTARMMLSAADGLATGANLIEASVRAGDGASGHAESLIEIRPHHVGPALQAVTYYYTGRRQDFVPPAYVRSVVIEARGARGGSASFGGVGGYGNFVRGEFPYVGEPFYIYVGEKGSKGTAFNEPGRGGYNGGGSGGKGRTPGGYPGGGGGGASDVRTISGSLPGSLESRLIVAGGGGGGGGNVGSFCVGGNGADGGRGGQSGANAKGGGFGGDAGGVVFGGGAGGFMGGHRGTLGVGGAGADTTGCAGAGGGGGGGLYGGGGGGFANANGGGGGGGGTLVIPPNGDSGSNPGPDASVTIWY